MCVRERRSVVCVRVGGVCACGRSWNECVRVGGCGRRNDVGCVCVCGKCRREGVCGKSSVCGRSNVTKGVGTRCVCVCVGGVGTIGCVCKE